MVRIAPSIASGPLTDLKKTLQDLELAGSSVIHFDIEDGHFVPEMNLGLKVIKELRPLTKLPFDIHLMVVNPERLISRLADMGVNMISVHYEACPYPRRTLRMIASLGMQAGLAFNPATEITDLSFCMPYLSFILVLTTEPEEEDCPFLPSILNKIRDNKSQQALKDVMWVVDGDISTKNAAEVIRAGADMLVIGRGIFRNNSIGKNIHEIKRACEHALNES